MESNGGSPLFSLEAKRTVDSGNEGKTDEEIYNAELERQKSLRATEQAKKFPYNDTVIFSLPEMLESVDLDDMGMPEEIDWNDYNSDNR